LSNIDANLVHLLVFLSEDAALQFQILKLLALLLILIAEDVGEDGRLISKLPQHLVVILVRLLVQLLQVQLQLALQLLLLVDAPLEVVDRRLNRKESTSMLSTCSLTVVVTPSFSLLSAPVRLIVN
jgi:hypothetical protein